jgi:hypothetical protein
LASALIVGIWALIVEVALAWYRLSGAAPVAYWDVGGQQRFATEDHNTVPAWALAL